MKQKLRRFMAGFLAILTMFTTLFTNGTTAFAASSSANIAFWVASSKDQSIPWTVLQYIYCTGHLSVLLPLLWNNHNTYNRLEASPELLKGSYSDYCHCSLAVCIKDQE